MYMSTIKSEIIQTLGDALTAMSSFAGGSVPGSNTTAYAQWVRWIQLAQFDAARRGFWSRCLAKTNLAITKDVDYVALPGDFFKRNGIYVLNVGEDDWNANNNGAGQRLMVLKDPTSGAWIVKFIGFTPTESATGTLWYFYNPPVPTNEADLLWLDGEMIMFGALKEYFRQARQPGSQDDARNEYENRFNENLNLEVLPTPQELMGWQSVYEHNKLSPMDEIHRSSVNRRRR